MSARHASIATSWVALSAARAMASSAIGITENSNGQRLKVTLTVGSAEAIATMMATRPIWVMSIHPRRRPSGGTKRSSSGAHRNLKV